MSKALERRATAAEELAADIYGYLDDSDSIGVILEDEIQGIEKETDKIKIYKAGYKKGAKIPRTLLTQNDRVIKYYNPFCLKAVASEQLPSNKGFRERFLEIPMTVGYPQKEWSDVTATDLEYFNQLRNKLLKWRLQTREQPLPDVTLPIKGRLKELWKPIIQITNGLPIYDTLYRFIEDQKKERLNTKQATLEGKLVKITLELLIADNPTAKIYTVTFQKIWEALKEDLDGKIDDKKPNTMDTSDFGIVTKNKIGYRLREILSGKTKTTSKKDDAGKKTSVKEYDFEIFKLSRIAKKYGYDELEKKTQEILVTKLPSLPSSPTTQPPSYPQNSTLTQVEGNKSMDFSMLSTARTEQNDTHNPEELSKLSNSVTNQIEHPLDYNKIAIYTFPDKTEIPQNQPCSVCHQTKPLTLRYQTYDSHDGYLYACIDCGDEIRYHADNRED